MSKLAEEMRAKHAQRLETLKTLQLCKAPNSGEDMYLLRLNQGSPDRKREFLTWLGPIAGVGDLVSRAGDQFPITKKQAEGIVAYAAKQGINMHIYNETHAGKVSDGKFFGTVKSSKSSGGWRGAP